MAFPYVANAPAWVEGAAPGISAARLTHLETQFQSVIDLLTIRGDLPYRGAATWERLAKGTAGQFLSCDANDPVWVDDPAPAIDTGNYTGNEAADRQITTGFKCSMVIILTNAGTVFDWIILATIGSVYHHTAAGNVAAEPNVHLHAGDGFEVDAAGDSNANVTARVYYYWAISE